MLLSHVGHFTENELAGQGPEEGLDWELVHVAELEAHSDVVIIFDSLDLAPENELFSLDSCLKRIQSHLDLHTLVQVERGPVVAEVFDLFTEVQDVHLCFRALC